MNLTESEKWFSDRLVPENHAGHYRKPTIFHVSKIVKFRVENMPFP